MDATVIAAKNLANRFHGKQLYGDQPYMVHLESVVAKLANYGTQAQIIGYLHDVLEDTDITADEIRRVFGDDIAESVMLLTDEPGDSRKERKHKTYMKMREAGDHLAIALTVKVADRLSNVEACMSAKNVAKFNLYKREHDAFKSAVYRKGTCDDLWEVLDRMIHVGMESTF